MGTTIRSSFEEKRDRLIFDLAQNTIEREWQRVTELDGKAANFVGFTGVIISILIGLASLGQMRLAANSTILAILIIGIFVLLASFGMSLSAYRVRRWRLAPNPVAVISGYADRTYEDLLLAAGGEMAKISGELRLENNVKAMQILVSSYLLFAGLMITLIFVVATVFFV